MKRRTTRGLARAEREGATPAGQDESLDPLGGFEAFIQRLSAHCPPELLADVEASLEGPGALVARLHGSVVQRAATREGLRALGWPLVPIDRALDEGGDVFLVTQPEVERRTITDSAPVREGRVYLMNPSSLLPGLALAPGPDDAVLDLCAAPGGKTLHLATLMAGGDGTLTAVEAIKPRFFKLRGQLQRFGEGHVKTYLKDGRDVGRAVGERFDRVLLDAPCSSEARIRRDDPESYAHWNSRKVRDCQHKQLGLLRSGLDALKVGGRLVYCTCSFSAEENEEVVATILAERGESVRLVPTGLDALSWLKPPALRPGIAGDPLVQSLARRVWPDAVWDGFFVAALEKVF